MSEPTGDARRADELRAGDVLKDGRKVTKSWKAYRVGNGWGSVGVDGHQVRMFCADAVDA